MQYADPPAAPYAISAGTTLHHRAVSHIQFVANGQLHYHATHLPSCCQLWIFRVLDLFEPWCSLKQLRPGSLPKPKWPQQCNISSIVAAGQNQHTISPWCCHKKQGAPESKITEVACSFSNAAFVAYAAKGHMLLLKLQECSRADTYSLPTYCPTL